jgi:phage pi2 protein 07
MQKITQKEYKKEFKEIKEYFKLKFYGDINKKNSIKTKWGIYNFFFDNDSIFGRFEDLKINELPPEVQNTKNGFFKVSYYPNLNSGKMNFHFYEIFDFINTLDRIWINE